MYTFLPSLPPPCSACDPPPHTPLTFTFTPTHVLAQTHTLSLFQSLSSFHGVSLLLPCFDLPNSMATYLLSLSLRLSVSPSPRLCCAVPRARGRGRMENHDPQIFRSSPLLPVSSSSSSYGDWDEPRDTVLSCRGLPWHLALAVGSLSPLRIPSRLPFPLSWPRPRSAPRVLVVCSHLKNGTTFDCFIVFALNIPPLLILAFFLSFSLFAVPQLALGQGFLELSPSPRIHPAQSIQQKLPQGHRHVK
ncbi:hypothetical protein LX32DRAFT_430176 [Colletotrichum zoysiae]|uniref:Uncharacterized protein n=1 Tax=Colletotrichum zoysiae TaxID=1216348 RepID=A0AAD9HES9_9PEZI|nr:hypothetical protein LX32DRAFT_430176 [Colletotrichum zoysiae]